MRDLEHGLNIEQHYHSAERPFIRKWGARAILREGLIDLVPDHMDYTEENCELASRCSNDPFRKWIFDEFLPVLNKVGFHPSSSQSYTMVSEKFNYVGVANPKGSYGFLFIGAGEIEPPIKMELSIIGKTRTVKILENGHIYRGTFDLDDLIDEANRYRSMGVPVTISVCDDE